jgi:hypothetical protein
MKQLKTMAGVLCVFLALQACKKTVIEGPAGKDGASGTNGTNGSNGVNGTNGVTTYNFTVTSVDTVNEYLDPIVIMNTPVYTTRTDFNVPTLTQDIIDKGSVIISGKRIIPFGFVATGGLTDSTSWFSLPMNSQITDGTKYYPNSYNYSFRKGVVTLHVKIRSNPSATKYFVPIQLKVTTIN